MTVDDLIERLKELQEKHGQNEVGRSTVVVMDPHLQAMSEVLGYTDLELNYYDGNVFIKANG